MKKIVSNQISPNLFLSDWFYAGWKSLLGNKCGKEKFEQFFSTKEFFLCNSARSALWKVCELSEVPKDKKIAIPAFICAVVATPFLDQGYQIEWIDTDKNGVLDPNDLAKKIDNIGIVVAPHIFGQKVNLNKIKQLCQPKNILVIEDCAHHFDPKDEVLADIRIASFGREKVFSCVSGGAVFWNKNSVLAKKLKNFTPPKPNKNWEFKNWMQVFWYGTALPWWNWGGKIIPSFAKKLNWLPLAVSANEKKGIFEMPITALANKQKWILYKQLNEQKNKLEHAQKISHEWKTLLEKYFDPNNIILPPNNFRVILKCNYKTQKKILHTAQKHKYYLREWDGIPISPAGTDLKALNYEQKKCLNAEKFAKNYVTFPVNLRTKTADVKRFEKILKEFL